jgi:glycosyltransferase involved in cell wall biosynthesis
LPQSILQALAAAVPVVATRVGGVPEVVMHENTGYLVETGDHEGLAREIIKALKEPEKARQTALAGQELVRGRHSIGHMLDEIERAYSATLRQG